MLASHFFVVSATPYSSTDPGLAFTEERTNFELTIALDDHFDEEEGEYSSQQRAVGLVFAVGIVVGVVINFINLHTDFQVRTG